MIKSTTNLDELNETLKKAYQVPAGPIGHSKADNVPLPHTRWRVIVDGEDGPYIFKACDTKKEAIKAALRLRALGTKARIESYEVKIYEVARRKKRQAAEAQQYKLSYTDYQTQTELWAPNQTLSNGTGGPVGGSTTTTTGNSNPFAQGVGWYEAARSAGMATVSQLEKEPARTNTLMAPFRKLFGG